MNEYTDIGDASLQYVHHSYGYSFDFFQMRWRPVLCSCGERHPEER